MADQQKKTSKTRRRKPLSPAYKRFVHAYIMTNNATEAVRQAYPETAGKSTAHYLRVKAHRMMTNDNVKLEIEAQKLKLEELASRATYRIGELIDSDRDSIALDASKWTYEQVHGKAKQKIEHKSAMVFVSYDLSGGNGGEIPAHIMKQLEAQEPTKD